MDIPPRRTPVIIIDALDECGSIDGDQSAGRKESFETLERWPQLSTKFKLVITSRPGEDIERALSDTIFTPIDLPSGTAVTSDASKDINAFFVHRFRKTAKRFAEPGLAQD